MGIILTIVVGAVIGWIGSIIMRTNAQQGALANIVIGIVGSLIGKFVFSDLLGIGGASSAGALSVPGFIWGVLGAVVLIALLKAFHVMGNNR